MLKHPGPMYGIGATPAWGRMERYNLKDWGLPRRSIPGHVVGPSLHFGIKRRSQVPTFNT